MSGELLANWAPELGPWGLVTLFVVLVLTGRLVPRRQLQDWIDAYRESEQQKRELLDAVQVTQQVLRSLPEAAPEKDWP